MKKGETQINRIKILNAGKHSYSAKRFKLFYAEITEQTPQSK